MRILKSDSSSTENPNFYRSWTNRNLGAEGRWLIKLIKTSLASFFPLQGCNRMAWQRNWIESISRNFKEDKAINEQGSVRSWKEIKRNAIFFAPLPVVITIVPAAGYENLPLSPAYRDYYYADENGNSSSKGLPRGRYHLLNPLI